MSQYRGDAIEAYFGWPAAYEDASERAVRAGLEVIEAVKAIVGPEPLQVRVGINTGMVMVGESGLGDPSKPSAAVGEALHVAARLLALAMPNSVVIAEATSRLISTRFEREDRGSGPKSVGSPVRAFRVWHVREDTSRFQAAHAAALTPLIGRRTELAFLQARWRDARRADHLHFRHGRIGKSRIVHELEERIKSEPHFTLSLQCLPHCMQPAVSGYPADRATCGPRERGPDAVKLRKLENCFAGNGASRQRAAIDRGDALDQPDRGSGCSAGADAPNRGRLDFGSRWSSSCSALPQNALSCA